MKKILHIIRPRSSPYSSVFVEGDANENIIERNFWLLILLCITENYRPTFMETTTSRATISNCYCFYVNSKIFLGNI